MRPKTKRGHKKDRVYSADFKENAIQLALHSPSIEAAARELGIPKQTLYSWVIKFRKGQLPKYNSELDCPKMENLQSKVVSLIEENSKMQQCQLVLP